MEELDSPPTEEYFHLIQIIEKCLGTLRNSFEEQDQNVEFDTLKKEIDKLLQCLGNCDLRKYGCAAIDNISSLKILHEELMVRGKWNGLKYSSLANLMDSNFETLYNVFLKTIFTAESDFDRQAVFEKCMEKLLNTVTLDNFKQHPSLIEVYISMIQEIQVPNSVRTNAKSLTFSLILIDDFEPTNKIKGLKCCKTILHSLSPNHFCEMTFQTLNKLFKEKDLDITTLLVECQSELIRIVPLDIMAIKVDAILSLVLEEILLDANYYRKTILLSLLQQIISLYGINCVSHKKSFNLVICDSIDMCTNIAIRDVMLANILQCTEVWIKYCWAAWKYSADQKLLRIMLKMLYVLTENEQHYIERVQTIIVSLIFLCGKEEQNQIIVTLKQPDRSEVTEENDVFFARIDVILSKCSAQVI